MMHFGALIQSRFASFDNQYAVSSADHVLDQLEGNLTQIGYRPIAATLEEEPDLVMLYSSGAPGAIEIISDDTQVKNTDELKKALVNAIASTSQNTWSSPQVTVSPSFEKMRHIRLLEPYANHYEVIFNIFGNHGAGRQATVVRRNLDWDSVQFFKR